MHLLPGILSRRLKARYVQKLFPLIITVLAGVTLACGLGRSGSRLFADRGFSLTRLPTLTRTPLPTLTPTVIPIDESVLAETNEGNPLPTSTATAVVPPAAVAMATEPTAIARPAEAVAPPIPEAAVPPTPVVSTAAPASISAPQPGPQPLQAAEPALPLPTATDTETPSPTDTPTVAATETPLPTDTPTITPTPAAWAFNEVRTLPSPDDGGLLLLGNVVNNTGAAQEVQAISGAFYDDQGQMIASTDRTYSYYPIYVLPSGGRAPFRMTIEGINSAANFELDVQAEPSEEIPRQDFDISDVKQWNEDDYYCLSGTLRYSGSAIQEYLIIAANLYDAQDKLVNFGDYEEFGLIAASADAASHFEICIEPPNQDVVRYEIQAWGR